MAVLAGQRKLLGKRHPDTIRTQNNLAALLHTYLGEKEDAIVMQREVVALLTTVLGATNEQTKIAAQTLARWEAVTPEVQAAAKQAAHEQLADIAAVSVEGLLSQPEYNGVYLRAGEYDGWVHFESAQGMHLFNRGREWETDIVVGNRSWVLKDTFEPDGTAAYAYIKTEGPLPDGNRTWRVLVTGLGHTGAASAWEGHTGAGSAKSFESGGSQWELQSLTVSLLHTGSAVGEQTERLNELRVRLLAEQDAGQAAQREAALPKIERIFSWAVPSDASASTLLTRAGYNRVLKLMGTGVQMLDEQWGAMCEQVGADPTTGFTVELFFALLFFHCPRSALDSDLDSMVAAIEQDEMAPAERMELVAATALPKIERIFSWAAESADTATLLTHAGWSRAFAAIGPSPALTELQWVEICQAVGADPSAGLTAEQFLTILGQTGGLEHLDFMMVVVERDEMATPKREAREAAALPKIERIFSWAADTGSAALLTHAGFIRAAALIGLQALPDEQWAAMCEQFGADPAAGITVEQYFRLLEMTPNWSERLDWMVGAIEREGMTRVEMIAQREEALPLVREMFGLFDADADGLLSKVDLTYYLQGIQAWGNDPYTHEGWDERWPHECAQMGCTTEGITAEAFGMFYEKYRGPLSAEGIFRKARADLDSCKKWMASHDDCSFQTGAAVSIHGLVGAPQHNGKCATVRSKLDAKSGRHAVEMEDGKRLNVKPVNLKAV
eukprot:SAG22_NODE_339_length_12034_cov_3.087474_6_plen_729_part_00